MSRSWTPQQRLHAGNVAWAHAGGEILRAARDLGATQAVVGPRGDDGYPVPRRLYAGLGLPEVTQIVPFTTG